MSDDQEAVPGLQVQQSVRTALIDGVTFTGRPVQYAEVDGLAIFEGDIVLGAVEELESDTAARRRFQRRTGARSNVISGDWNRWPGGVIPYEIDPGLPEQARVTEAISHWHERTAFRLVPRAGQADYVRFLRGPNCDSQVGRSGGGQDIRITDQCDRGSVIHEIFHAVGAWHEQSREDRDLYVRIIWENIDPAQVQNFNQHVNDNDDVGPYDYGSVMHYPRTAFSVNGGDTIVPLMSGVVIGQRDGLSDLDVEAVKWMYPDLAWGPKDPKENPKTDNPKDGINDSFGTKLPTDDPPFKEPKLDRTYKENPKERSNEVLTPAKATPWRDGVLQSSQGAVPFVLGSAGPPPAAAGTMSEALLGLQFVQLLTTFQQLSALGQLDREATEAWRAVAAAYARIAG